MARVTLTLEDVPGGHVHVACDWGAVAEHEGADAPTPAQELAAAVFVFLERSGALAKPES